MRILIAEDDATSRMILKSILTTWGYEVVETLDGTEAWQALEEEDAPRLVILDRIMPGMNGEEICRKLRETQPLTSTYIILLTSKGEKEDVVEGLEAGANDYIRKPFKLDELEIVVKNACEKILLVRENKGLLRRLKEAMEEMKGLGVPSEERTASTLDPSPPAADRKIFELDVFLNQMTPPSYEVPLQEPRERALQDLEKLIQLRKDGFIDALEFYSLKKMLLEPARD